MSKFILTFIVALTVLFFLAAPQLGAQESDAKTYIVVGEDGVLPEDFSDLVENAGGTIHRIHNEIGIASAQSDDPNFGAAMESYEGIESCTEDIMVQWVPTAEELDLEVQSLDDTEVPPPSTDINAFVFLPPQAAFFFACQWNMTQINTPGAWNAGEFGNSAVRVAVLDTGVDPFHFDQLDKLDIAASTSTLSAGSSPCGPVDETTIFDFNFHGAFVSGLISTNNFGIAGVAPLTTLVGVKVLNCAGFGSFADIIAGIITASVPPVNADIINMSLGAYFPKNLPGAGALISALNNAVNFAKSKGILVVSASGNNGVNLDNDKNFTSVPAQSGSGISIWAGDINGNLASYSNFGRSGTWVGAGGGGTSISPLIPLPGCVIPLGTQGRIISICSTNSIIFPACGPGSYLINAQGTSFSAPLATGVAALVDGKHGGFKNGGQLRTILSQTADDLGKKGVDLIFSHGRVNAGNAITK